MKPSCGHHQDLQGHLREIHHRELPHPLRGVILRQQMLLERLHREGLMEKPAPSPQRLRDVKQGSLNFRKKNLRSRIHRYSLRRHPHY